MAGYLERVSRPGVAVCVLLTLLVVGCLGPGESELLEISDPAVPATVGSDPSVTVATVAPGTSSVVSVPASSLTPSVDERLVATVTSDGLVERGVQVQVGPPPVPPTTSRPGPFPGDCLSWSGEFVARGATAAEIEFFFAGGIIERESGCGRDTLNDRTGDSGICQLNPAHNRAGWFGGRYFGDGGWLLELHGLRTWQDTDSPVWVDACLTLYRVCGPGPWRLGDWGCANRKLDEVPL